MATPILEAYSRAETTIALSAISPFWAMVKLEMNISIEIQKLRLVNIIIRSVCCLKIVGLLYKIKRIRIQIHRNLNQEWIDN